MPFSQARWHVIIDRYIVDWFCCMRNNSGQQRSMLRVTGPPYTEAGLASSSSLLTVSRSSADRRNGARYSKRHKPQWDRSTMTLGGQSPSAYDVLFRVLLFADRLTQTGRPRSSANRGCGAREEMIVKMHVECIAQPCWWRDLKRHQQRLCRLSWPA